MPRYAHHESSRESAGGRLIYVAGPSGAGKDTLLQYVREHLPAAAPVVISHRYITRPHRSELDNHVPLTPDEFALRAQAGFFSMRWRANGLAYGIGIEVDGWLRRGFHVIVNGSRGYLPEARRIYSELQLVWVSAPIDVLNARLARRARESAAEIEHRVARASALAIPLEAPDLTLINDGAFAEAGEQLLAFIMTSVSSNQSRRPPVESVVA